MSSCVWTHMITISTLRSKSFCHSMFVGATSYSICSSTAIRSNRDSGIIPTQSHRNVPPVRFGPQIPPCRGHGQTRILLFWRPPSGPLYNLSRIDGSLWRVWCDAQSNRLSIPLIELGLGKCRSHCSAKDSEVVLTSLQMLHLWRAWRRSRFNYIRRTDYDIHYNAQRPSPTHCYIDGYYSFSLLFACLEFWKSFELKNV